MQMPSPGAVCPAMVKNDLLITSGFLSSIVPERSNTIVRGPSALAIPSRSEPGPSSASVVT